MPVQIQNDVTAEYTSPLTIADTGEVLTEAQLYDTTLALANRIEFVRALTPEASDDPESFFIIREDFAGAVFTSAQSRLDGSFPWRTVSTGSVSINHSAGSAKNPGQLVCAMPGDGANEQYFGFHIGLANGTPVSYATFQQLAVTVRIDEASGNINEQIRFGLTQDASAFNGGTDCLCIARLRASDADDWVLLRRVASSQTLTVLAAFTNDEFATWKMLKTAAGDIEISLDGTLVHTVDSADLPSGSCNLSFLGGVSSADTEVLTVTWDLVSYRGAPGDRSGA